MRSTDTKQDEPGTYAGKISSAKGGGGLWFLAHIGVLQAMQEEGIPLHAITGASGGALIGAVASSWVDENTGQISKEGIAFMTRAVQSIHTFQDLTRTIHGKTVIDIDRILSGGGSAEYAAMMRRGPTVSFSGQVMERGSQGKRNEVFLQANPGDSMERVLRIAQASAANRPMFGLDPVEIDGVEYSDDLSVSTRSVSAGVRNLRDRFAGIQVIGTSLSFKDSMPAIRRTMDFLRPAYKDCGDVRILPKDGHQLFNGDTSLTNVVKGVPFFGGRWYAKTPADIEAGKKIRIPVDDFIAAGYQAAKKKIGELLRLMPSR